MYIGEEEMVKTALIVNEEQNVLVCSGVKGRGRYHLMKMMVREVSTGEEGRGGGERGKLK